MKSNKGTAGIIFILILVSLVVLIGIAFLYVNKDKILPTKNETKYNKTLAINNSFIKFRALEYGTQKQIEANYELWINKSYYKVIKYPNGTIQKNYHEQITKLRQGRTKSFVYEFLTQLEKNQSFIIYAWDEDKRESDYYFKHMDCRSNETCEIWLKKQAKINVTSSASEGKGTLEIKAFQGKINEPLILFSYPYYVSNVELNGFERVEVPKDKKLYFDRAYKIESIDDSGRIMYFAYEKDEDQEAYLNITIIDLGYYDKIGTFENSNKIGIEDYSINQKI